MRNSGDVDTLRELGDTHGFEVLALDDIGEGDATTRWSSTQLRAELLEGKVAHAAQILGRPHRVAGTVVHGDHRGRELGLPDGQPLAGPRGPRARRRRVCRVAAAPDLPAGRPRPRLPAAVSVGTNPTFDGHQRRVEAYVLDRTDLDLYGERVVVSSSTGCGRPCGSRRSTPLVEQMAQDVARCREILSRDRPVLTVRAGSAGASSGGAASAGRCGRGSTSGSSSAALGLSLVGVAARLVGDPGRATAPRLRSSSSSRSASAWSCAVVVTRLDVRDVRALAPVVYVLAVLGLVAVALAAGLDGQRVAVLDPAARRLHAAAVGVR